MRKSAIITILLLGLAAASLYSAHAWVGAQKAAVSIDETIVYGDKSVAEGISLDIRTHCGYRLFWDTRYTIGEKPEIGTDFAFSQSEQRPSRNIPYSYLYFDGTFNGYGASSSGALDITGEVAPVQDVASRTAPGDTHTEIVSIKDYYQFYPIHVEFDTPSRFAVNEDTQKLFANYLKIPVHPEHQVEISIEKDGAGNVRSVNLSTAKDSGVFLETPSVMTDAGCFFTFSCRTAGGRLLDTSHLAGGYGIYYFPLHNQGGDDRTLTVDELRMVFPIDAEGAEVIGLQASADRSRLFLVTMENQSYTLTVIDAKTMLQVQKLAMLPADAGNGFSGLHIHDNFVVPVRSDGRFALLASDAEGAYEERFAADFGDELRSVFSPGASMDFNGEQLAIAAFNELHYAPDRDCSFYLAIFDEQGLAYAAEYEHSLDRDLSEYRLSCLPFGEAALTVTWGDR